MNLDGSRYSMTSSTNTSDDATVTFDFVAYQPELGTVAYALAKQGDDAKKVAEDAGLNPTFVLEKARSRVNLSQDLSFQEVPPDGDPQQVYAIGQVTFDLDGSIVSHDFDPSGRDYYHVEKGDTGQVIGPDVPASDE